MQNGNLKINDIKIVNTLIEINRNCKDKLNLQVGCRGRVGKPQNINDQTLLLNVTVDIVSADSEDLKIQLESDVFFSYNVVPNDFDWMVENECMPMAQKSIFDKLDNLLIELGYEKMNLSENI